MIDRKGQKTNLIVLTGPTATGKTALAISLAGRLPRGAEVVSADSMMVYRGMDIGTAKPTTEEMAAIPHHLVDVVDPDEAFSVARYRELADRAIRDVASRGHWPMLVGGSGLYVRAVLDGMQFVVGANDELRRELAEQARAKGVDWLHAKLAEVDPQRAGALHPNNVRRVIRALEIYHQTGQPASAFNPFPPEGESKYVAKVFGLTMDRQRLYERIDARVDAMLEAGLVDEVERLLMKGYSRSLPAMQGLGYKEIAAYVAGETGLEEAVEHLKRNTRRFAKRQYTWFRGDRRIVWIDVGKGGTQAATEEILGYMAGEPT